MTIFPTLSSGYRVQLPYSRGVQFSTRAATGLGGMRYTYATRTTPRHVWQIEYTALTDAEAEALAAFFVARGGRLESFLFPDPQDNTTYVVTFDQDDLSVTAVGRNEHRATVRLAEVSA